MIPEQELRQMYHDKNMSQREIAKEIGVVPSTVFNWMKVYKIKSRTVSEAWLIGISVPSEEELYNMYRVQMMSQSEIAKKIGVVQSAVFNWMKEYGIETRTNSESKSFGKYTGENCPNWKGGISFEPYCHRFNNPFKEAVRERDDYTCQLCGHEQKLNGRKLSIHHIHYDKENCYPDVVALCRSCNSMVNSNRNYWEEYFENKLLERGLYCWSFN